jgi:hypothetical protein
LRLRFTAAALQYKRQHGSGECWQHNGRKTTGGLAVTTCIVHSRLPQILQDEFRGSGTASLGRNFRHRTQEEKSGWAHDIDEVGSGIAIESIGYLYMPSSNRPGLFAHSGASSGDRIATITAQRQ